MSRTWKAGDEEPSDHPVIVDDDSVMWTWEEVDEDAWLYVQWGVTINGNGGEGPIALSWWAILEEFGPVREVTPEEIESLDVTYRP